MPYAYILRSLKDGKYYYGSAENVQIRLRNHNDGSVRSTKARRPLALVHSEHFATRTEAIKREKFFKSIKGYLWLKEQRII
jgi:putative endonuclease